MYSSPNLPIGVCDFPLPERNKPRTTAHNDYIHEILEHAGLAYSRLSLDQLADWLAHGQVLVTVGETQLDSYLLAQLEHWVGQGGAWLSIGGLCGAGDLFGAEYAVPVYSRDSSMPGVCTLGEGYLVAGQHRLFEHLEIPLHYFSGIALKERAEQGVLARGYDAHGRATGRPVVLEHGNCLLLAVDATGTIVHVQQGRAVTRDGIPTSDGTAAVSDGLLKSEDGAVLDWHFDRQEVPGVPGLQGFLQPVADAWREIVLRAIFYLAEKVGAPAAVLWYYPRNLPAVAHMSHDSDLNDAAHAHHLLDLLRDTDIKSTWCVIAPGYERELIDTIAASGHELAMHYDAVDEPWGYDEFVRQWELLKDLFGGAPLSNKNHYTRWEGDCEFFDWCQAHGIQLEQTKGVSKIGCLGYNFGTCHTYFPVQPDGRKAGVLAMATICQDLEVFAPSAAADILLAKATQYHGLFHMLFHPAHTHKPEVDRAFRAIVAKAKAAGLEWWTARQINDWERARRRVVWRKDDPESAGVCLQSESHLEQATVLTLNFSPQLRVNGEDVKSVEVQRWGCRFEAIQLDMQPGVEYALHGAVFETQVQQGFTELEVAGTLRA